MVGWLPLRRLVTIEVKPTLRERTTAGRPVVCVCGGESLVRRARSLGWTNAGSLTSAIEGEVEHMRPSVVREVRRHAPAPRAGVLPRTADHRPRHDRLFREHGSGLRVGRDAAHHQLVRGAAEHNTRLAVRSSIPSLGLPVAVVVNVPVR